MKYYFGKDDEVCYNIEYFRDFMRMMGMREMQVHEAVIERGLGIFYCTKENEIMESGCGCSASWCEHYQPRNKIKGICKYYGYVYSRGKKIIIRL